MICVVGGTTFGVGLGIVGNLARSGASSVSQIFFILLRKILLCVFFFSLRNSFSRVYLVCVYDLLFVRTVEKYSCYVCLVNFNK